MPVILKSVDDYVVKIRKRDSFWFVFNKNYNNVHAYKIASNDFNYLDKESTDNDARNDFFKYMKENFPNTKLVEVFDLVNSSYVIYPYLGSVLVECEKDDEVFIKLSEKYGNPYEEAKGNNCEENYTKNVVFWVIDLKNATEFYQNKNDYGDDF